MALRKIRITAACLFFAAITLLFLDFTGTVHTWLGWMAKIQFIPAILSFNAGIILLLVLLTLLFGRVYCSVICPLGVMQDIVSWLNGRRKKNRYRFSYSPAKNALRSIVLVVFIVMIIAGIGSFVALLAPYSSYGRIVSNLFAPLYGLGNNLLAYFAERGESYAFYETTVWIKSLPTFIISVLTFITLCVLAWRGGRTYCNTICPVGTVLGLFSRYSLFRVVIDKSKCTACGLCSHKCKAACVDGKKHRIDYSRCVACMDCIDTCTHGAIQYRIFHKNRTVVSSNHITGNKPADAARRYFLTVTATIATTTALKAQEKKVDGGLAVITGKAVPKRNTTIVPPGALSIRNFASHCTACQLCVSVCPNSVLRPTSRLETLMQPEISYERGYCRPECTRCSEVCPTGAIRPITVAEKSAEQIGHAVWIKKNCIPLTDGLECDNCARHCPTGAIQMIPSDAHHNLDSIKIPAINMERCIGCGACENLCPARPFSAIYIEGHKEHRII